MKIACRPMVLALAALAALFAVGCRGEDSPGTVRVAFVQYVDSAESEEVRRAALEGLAEAGLRPGNGLEARCYSAGADFALLQSIAGQASSAGYDVIITFGTPATQAVYSRIGDRPPLVFGLVSDPVSAGLCRSPEDHPANLAGYYGLFPTTDVLDLVQAMLPEAESIGVVWNSGESNSRRYLEIIRTETARRGLRLEETPVAGTGEILAAAEGLAARDVDLFFCAGDSTVIQGFEALASVGNRRGIPVAANVTSLVHRGAAFSLGRSFSEEGLAVGRLAAGIVSGEIDPATTPLRRLERFELRVNEALMARYGLTVPDRFRRWMHEPADHR